MSNGTVTRISMCSLRVPSRVASASSSSKSVGLAIEHAVALLDGGVADGLRKVTLAGWTEKQGVFVACDESAGGEIENQAAIHLLVKGEVEVVEGLLGVGELGLFCPPLQHAFATQGEFVGDQARQQVDGGERFGLGLAQTGLQHGAHVRASENPFTRPAGCSRNGQCNFHGPCDQDKMAEDQSGFSESFVLRLGVVSNRHVPAISCLSLLSLQ